MSADEARVSETCLGVEQNVALFLMRGKEGGPPTFEETSDFAHRVWWELEDRFGIWGELLERETYLWEGFDCHGNKWAIRYTGKAPGPSPGVVVIQFSTAESNMSGVEKSREFCLEGLGRAAGSVIVDTDMDAVISSPAFLDRHGRARPFVLPFDVNVSLGTSAPEKEELDCISSFMAAITANLAPGGLAGGRFRISPSSAGQPGIVDFDWPYVARAKRQCADGLDRTEYRLHLRMEPGFRSRSATSRALAATRIALEMSRAGLLRDLRLSNPALAVSKWTAGLYDTGRCRLASGKIVAAQEFRSMALERLDRFIGSGGLPEELLPVACCIRDGLQSVAGTYPADSLQSLDYFRKRRLFRKFAESLGVEAGTLEDLFGALYLVSVPLVRLRELKPAQVSRRIGQLGGWRADKLERLLTDGQIGSADIIQAAEWYKKWEAIDISLHQYWPEPPPLRSEDDLSLLMLESGVKSQVSSRAESRGRQVAYIKATGSESRVLVDWGYMIGISEAQIDHAGVVDICLQSFEGSPGDDVSESISRIKLDPDASMEMFEWRSPLYRALASAGVAIPVGLHCTPDAFKHEIKESSEPHSESPAEQYSLFAGDEYLESPPAFWSVPTVGVPGLSCEQDGASGEKGEEL